MEHKIDFPSTLNEEDDEIIIVGHDSESEIDVNVSSTSDGTSHLDVETQPPRSTRAKKSTAFMVERVTCFYFQNF